MVDKSYMLEQPAGPSPARVAFDQKVVPVFIDAAGAVEVGMQRVLGAVRSAPSTSLLIAAGLGFLLGEAARRLRA